MRIHPGRRRFGVFAGGLQTVLLTALIAGCPGNTPAPQNGNTNGNGDDTNGKRWSLVLSGQPAGLLSASGTSAADVYAVGADPGDGSGPLILHYDGQRWTRLVSGAASDLWWVSDRQVGDSFFMVGENGLVLRYRPSTDAFEEQQTPGDATLFGIWGVRPDNVWAAGGDVNDPDTSGVIWHYDGTAWTAADVTAIDAAGIPVLFKVWGRSEDEIYAVGARGVILRYDGTSWTQLDSPTTRTLFTVHGNPALVVATGGAQSGVIVESTGGAFADVTPAGALQMNGAFAPPAGDAVAVGREGAVALRRSGAWVNEDTGLGLDVTLDYHAAWIDQEGGIWAVGGSIVGEPRTDGVLSYFGGEQIATQLDGDGNTNGGDAGTNGPGDGNTNGSGEPKAIAVLGYTDPLSRAFTPVADGEVMPLYTGGQGGSHIFVTVRINGFPASDEGYASVRLDEVVTLESDGRVLHDIEQVVRFLPVADNTMEISSRFVFLDAVPTTINGRVAIVDFGLTSEADPAVTARIRQSILLDLQP